MVNPQAWVVATVLSVAVGIGLFIYQALNTNTPLENTRNRNRRRERHSDECDSCGQRNDRHSEGCILKPSSPTKYHVFSVIDNRRGTDEKCLICHANMTAGEIVARLPCLCLYHKPCIDRWFREKPVCPVHLNYG